MRNFKNNLGRKADLKSVGSRKVSPGPGFEENGGDDRNGLKAYFYFVSRMQQNRGSQQVFGRSTRRNVLTVGTSTQGQVTVVPYNMLHMRFSVF